VYSTKVILSFLSSPVVSSRDYVTLQCSSQEKYDSFILMKEDEEFSRYSASQNIYTGLFQATFTIDPVTFNQSWMFTCYGCFRNSSQLWSVPSDHIELPVSVIFHKPSIWAYPGTLITLNSPVTILCEGTRDTQIYVLNKEGSPVLWNRQMQKDDINKAKFTITSVTSRDAGNYCCYSYSSTGLSGYSDILELVVT
ncbi:leukocyte immunoglobulin-like receptor subfamily B member 3, partial [Sigmodon hispidus]